MPGLGVQEGGILFHNRIGKLAAVLDNIVYIEGVTDDLLLLCVEECSAKAREMA